MEIKSISPYIPNIIGKIIEDYLDLGYYSNGGIKSKVKNGVEHPGSFRKDGLLKLVTDICYPFSG